LTVTVTGELSPDAEYERITVLVDGDVWFDVLVPEPLEQGRPWLQIEGEVSISGLDVRLPGNTEEAEALTGRNIRGVVALAVSPVDMNRVWLASGYASVGVMRSDDGAASFQQVYPGLHFLSLAPDPSDADIILVGDKIGQIHRSLNAGLSWDVVRRIPVVEDKSRRVGIFGMAYDPNVVGRIVAASATGDVVESDDRGSSWTERPGLPSATCLAMRADGVAIVGTEAGVYGVSSSSVDSLPGGPAEVVSVAVSGGDTYVGGSDGLYAWDGSTFDRVGEFPEVLVGALSVPSSGAGVIVASAAGLHRVENGSITTISDDTRDKVAVLALQDSYLVTSPDPGHYQEYFQVFDPPVSGPKEGATFRVSLDGSWSVLPVDEPDGGAVTVDASGTYVLSAGSGSRGVYVSNDGGRVFRHEVAEEARYVQQLAVAPDAPNVSYIASAVGTYRSIDSGSTWTLVKGGAYFSSLAIDPTGTEVWLGTSTVAPSGVDTAGGSVAGIERDDLVLFQSVDQGQSVSEVLRFEQVGDVGASISAIARSRSGVAYLTIQTDGPTDIGGLWTVGAGESTRLQESDDFASVAVNSANEQQIAVASGSGLWLSSDGGLTLQRVSGEWTECVTFTASGLWVAGGEGVLIVGADSEQRRIVKGLHGRTVESVAFDNATQDVLAAISGLGLVRAFVGE
jgi:hypothetical protein